MHIFTNDELRQATGGWSDSRILGQGGFGVVFSASVQKGGFQENPVAVKRILLNDKRQAKMKSFSREIAAAAAVGKHHCLIEVVGMCKDGSDELALVYTPVASTSLANTLLPAGKLEVTLSPRERANIALCVVKGLEALHGARQIHLDLKSANILLIDRRGVKCVLADMVRAVALGVSSALESDCDTISFAPPEGEYPYWAPEYRKAGEASFAADMFCFGLILVELFMGTLLYIKPELTSASIEMVASMSEGVHSLADTSVTWESSLVASFLGLASRCLAEDRYSRPTAGDCVSALEDMLLEPASPVQTPTSEIGTPELSMRRPGSKARTSQTTSPVPESAEVGAKRRRTGDSAQGGEGAGAGAGDEQEACSAPAQEGRRLRPRRGAQAAPAAVQTAVPAAVR